VTVTRWVIRRKSDGKYISDRRDGKRVHSELIDANQYQKKMPMADIYECIPVRVTIEEEPAVYDPSFGDDRLCRCGHKYYRHFDTYEEMAPVGCKYCPCRTFEESAAPASTPTGRWPDDAKTTVDRINKASTPVVPSSVFDEANRQANEKAFKPSMPAPATKK
jgi:hypothetical protein